MEALVEGMAEHQVAAHQKVAGVKVHVGTLGAYLRPVHGLAGLFVAVAQVPRFARPHDVSAIGHVGHVALYVVLDETGAGYAHVAVEEQQPLIAALLCQEVADAGAAHVLLAQQVAAVRPSGNAGIGLQRFLVGRSVLGHHHLEADVQVACLFAKFLNQRVAGVVVGRYQYG